MNIFWKIFAFCNYGIPDVGDNRKPSDIKYDSRPCSGQIGIAANAPPRTPQLYSSTGKYIGRSIMYSAKTKRNCGERAVPNSVAILFYERTQWSYHNVLC